MLESSELITNGVYQNHTIKQNKEIEIAFCFGAEVIADILSLLSKMLGVYGSLKITKNKTKKELGEYKIYQARIFETGESIVTFRSDLEQVKAGNVAFLSPQKSKVKLEFHNKN